MTRTEYYELLKGKARQIRQEFGLDTAQVRLSDLRRICRSQGITVDYWKGSLKKVRGQYLMTDSRACIMVSAKLPDEQKIFTIAHELKHHFFDQGESMVVVEKEASEIGAEIFAVELIFPDADFICQIERLGVRKGTCTADDIVRLKHDSKTTLSYSSLAKRAMFNGYAASGSLLNKPWIKLRESMYGEPDYKRIQRYRKRRAMSS